MLAVEEQAVDPLAAPEVLVSEEHPEPRPDPVGDHKQEVGVLSASIVQPGQGEEEAGHPEHQGDNGTTQGKWQPDAECEE